MTDDVPPRLILGRFRPIDLARLLLVVLPAVPGLLFLVLGLMLDSHGHASGLLPLDSSAQIRRASQVRGLYLAGAITLLAGTLGMAAVVWKIARTRPEEETAAANGEITPDP